RTVADLFWCLSLIAEHRLQLGLEACLLQLVGFELSRIVGLGCADRALVGSRLSQPLLSCQTRDLFLLGLLALHFFDFGLQARFFRGLDFAAKLILGGGP